MMELINWVKEEVEVITYSNSGFPSAFMFVLDITLLDPNNWSKQTLV
jgi:hypothetical protein